MRQEKTEYLLSELGEIDDRYLAEALSYKAVAKKGSWVTVLAACFAAFFALAVVFPALLRLGQKNSMGESEAPDQNGQLQYSSLDEVFTSLNAADFSGVASFESLPYTADRASLVWQYENGEIYTAQLTREDLIKLQGLLGKGREVGVGADDRRVKVWILDGKGGVVTPYLKKSQGNVGRVVFDYEAEIYPSQDVIDCISEILSRGK